LFNSINNNRLEYNNKPQTVEVKVRGTDLVGVLNNTKYKYR